MNRQRQGKAQGRVAFEMHGRIAILEIDNPPVNAGSHAVRTGIAEGIARATENRAEGAVLLGAGRCFVAGADLREFGQKLAPPDLPQVIALIEAAPFPVVAALHGVALGGGLELALGCDYRLADPAVELGLPEISLGIIPGAGGTQRLPRLIGGARAIEVICGGARISGAEALELGLVDVRADGPLLEAALAFLAETPRPKRRTLDLPPPGEVPGTLDAAEQRALRRGKGRPNVTEAIRLIRAAISGDAGTSAALADERAVFQRLRVGADAKALRYLFFAERRAGRVEGLDMGLARRIDSVAVIGGGTMGQGIARAFLAAGLSVTLVEQDAAALERALGGIAASLDAQVRKGRLGADARAERAALLTGTIEYDALAGCDLAIEAVFEDMKLKQDLLARLEAALPAGAIIATNTSYLDIDTMAAHLDDPGRVIGLHFFSPADIMPLLELVRAARTSDTALATGLKLARRLGKQPVVAGVAEGFIGNRIYAAYRHRAELLVLDGAAPEAVDRAIEDFGFAMGPLAVSDLSGLDIAWARRKRLAQEREQAGQAAAPRDPLVADLLCEAGRLGRKTGKGWYDYSGAEKGGRPAPRPDPDVAALIDRAREEAGITKQEFDPRSIQRQLLAAMVNEAACVMADGIAQRASDVDVTLANGYGFPRWRGGPLYWASGQDRGALLADLDALAQAMGPGHRTGPVDAILNDFQTRKEG